jgi:DnaK suppressor protein
VTPVQLKSLRKLLVEHEKKLLTQKPRDLHTDGDKTDLDEAPLDEMNQVIASSRNKNDVVLLGKVRAAMKRLETDPDDFGNCTDCGDEIAFKRLEAMPWVELCVECQGKLDQTRRGNPRKNLTDFS